MFAEEARKKTHRGYGEKMRKKLISRMYLKALKVIFKGAAHEHNGSPRNK